jgi:hypothetical protein
MKNNYNIKLDPEQLSPEQIQKHKDFDALLHQFEQNPSPQAESVSLKPWYYIGGVVAAALIGAFFYFNGLNSNDVNEAISTKAYLASQPYVNPPIESLQQAFTVKQVDANQGGVFEYDNGSKIIVPAAAFVDQNRAIITGEVEIKFREYHDFIDFFVSGIPMEYDSAGTQYNLESAGMIEIYAEQNGQRLDMAPGKSIDIELISEMSISANNRASNPSSVQDDFNIYRLDEEARNWVYEGKDNITILEEDINNILSEGDDLVATLDQIEQEEKEALAAIEATLAKPIQPVRPVKENGSDFVFNLDFAEEDISISNNNATQAEQNLDATQATINELRRLYSNTLWQVAAGNDDFNEEVVSQINWEDAKITQLNNRDYELTLIHPERQLKVIVNPVLSGADYTNALSSFNQQMQDYEQQLSEREAQLASQKQALATRIQEERELAQKSYEEKIAYFQDQGNESAATELMITNRVMNSFSVSSFGIWNCDRPLPPFIYNIKGEFVENKSKKQFKHNTVYLADKNKNTIQRFYASEKADVIFDSRSENLLWMVTDDNKIAKYTPQQFKEIQVQSKEHTFVMDMVDQPITSEEDLRKILVF